MRPAVRSSLYGLVGRLRLSSKVVQHLVEQRFGGHGPRLPEDDRRREAS